MIEPILLAVLKLKRLRRYIGRRGRQSPYPRAERYLENFDDIWRLQGYLLDQANQTCIPNIANDDREEVFRKILLHVIDRLADGFAAPLATSSASGFCKHTERSRPERRTG